MSVDKLVDSTQLDADLTSIANAIRAKSGGSSQLAFPAGFVSEIGNIPSGGSAPFGLTKVKTLVDTTLTIDTELTASANDISVYTLDPLLKADYSETDWFLILGYVIWNGSGSPSSGQFVSSVSVIAVNRNMNSYYSLYSVARNATSYSTTYGYAAAAAQDSGMFLTSKSSNATNIVMATKYAKVNPSNKVVAGSYSVKAVLYKYNPLQLGGTL